MTGIPPQVNSLSFHLVQKSPVRSDVPPLETYLNLLEKGEQGLVITGDKLKLLGLVHIHESVESELVVEANWHSSDNIRVYISSALVSPRKAKSLAMQIVNEEPFRSWLPTYEKHDDSDEYQRNEKENYEAWIVCPSTDAKLDEYDPLGASCAVRRPYFSKEISALGPLRAEDPFNRNWLDSNDEAVAHSEAWAQSSRSEDDRSRTGERLVCSARFLKEALVAKGSELLLLIKLERYEQGSSYRESRFSNTTAVVRIKQSLDFEFYKGAVNQLHQMKS
jgi:hypothetical protein